MVSDESNMPEVSEQLNPRSILEAWNKMSGGNEVSISEVWENKDEVTERLWKAFSEDIDIYIERFDVPAHKSSKYTP